MTTQTSSCGTLISFILVLQVFGLISSSTCDGDCGWKADCINSTCICETGYVLHSNGRDCKNASCIANDCLDCSSESQCTRCAYFLEEGSRECLVKCTGEAKFVYSGEVQGSICVAENDDSLDRDVIIGITVGVVVAVLLIVVIVVLFCLHIKRTRRNVNLNQTQYSPGNMQAGNVKKVPMYDNKGFETDPESSLVHNVIDRDVYLHELEKLRPHAQTLLAMLNEIRHKMRAMDNTDPRVPTYKGVIHQLCRVLVLLHKKDPGASIPSDALGLMEWAHQMIEDRQLDSQQSDDSSGTPVNKISYVDVPEPNHYNPYATPVVQKPNPFASLKRNSQPLSPTAAFYSSVPVPVDMTTGDVNLKSVSQNSTLKRQYEIPWDLKKYSDSITTLNCSGSDLTMGYFSNGRFYDPTPRQPTTKPAQQPEVYAPASSYSDRSNPPVLSTFAGGVPRAQSFSSTQSSADTNDEEEQLEDGLPFDLKDATDPVMV